MPTGRDHWEVAHPAPPALPPVPVPASLVRTCRCCSGRAPLKTRRVVLEHSATRLQIYRHVFAIMCIAHSLIASCRSAMSSLLRKWAPTAQNALLTATRCASILGGKSSLKQVADHIFARAVCVHVLQPPARRIISIAFHFNTILSLV